MFSEAWPLLPIASAHHWSKGTMQQEESTRSKLSNRIKN